MMELPVNRVAFITIRGDTAGELVRRLNLDGFSVTRMESSHGLLLEPTSTVITGFPEARYPVLMEHVRTLCGTRTRLIPAQPDGSMVPALPMMVEAETGGATVSVMRVERCLQL
jgi:uncharacterized protein YaaQ